jgi:hypothetical protein
MRARLAINRLYKDKQPPKALIAPPRETDIFLKPGEFGKIMVTLERNRSANQNVLIDMLCKHLDRCTRAAFPMA